MFVSCQAPDSDKWITVSLSSRSAQVCQWCINLIQLCLSWKSRRGQFSMQMFVALLISPFSETLEKLPLMRISLLCAASHSFFFLFSSSPNFNFNDKTRGKERGKAGLQWFFRFHFFFPFAHHSFCLSFPWSPSTFPSHVQNHLIWIIPTGVSATEQKWVVFMGLSPLP